MSDEILTPIVAVDVGNTKIHLGIFRASVDALPRPVATLALDARRDSLDALPPWVRKHAQDDAEWVLASVNSPVGERLRSCLADNFPQGRVITIAHLDAPLTIEVDFPERVGIDRLLAAVAVNVLRDPMRPAIVIDAGTAITVDLVSAQGAFQGGAILPGMAMASQILDRYTDKLPWIDTAQLHAPPAVGKNTHEALASGIYWGTVGALTTLVEKMTLSSAAAPQLFITGGDAPRLVPQLAAAEWVPDLVLSGIVLTARQVGRDALRE